MADLQQWVVKCSRCNSSVKYSCDTCGTNFCCDCKDKHKLFEKNRNHIIVPYSQRLKAISNKCQEHIGFIYVAWCNTCNNAVCTNCMTSIVHEGHVFKSFHEKTNHKKEEVKKEYERTKAKCSAWEESLSNLKDEENVTENAFQKLESQIKEQVEALREEARKYEAIVLKALELHKQTYKQKVSNHEITLQNGIGELQHLIKKYEVIIRSKDAIEVLEFNLNRSKWNKELPEVFRPSPVPGFNKGNLTKNGLEEICGKLVLKEEHACDQRIPELVRQNPSKETHSKPNVKKDVDFPTPIQVETIVHQTDSHDASQIACISHDQAWVTTDKRKFKLIELSTRDIIKKFLFNETCCDATVTSSGEIMVLLDNQKSVWLLSREGKWKRMFTLHMTPYGICALNDGKILVAFKNDQKVILYSETGTQLMDMNFLKFTYPTYVKQNKVNKHIYIIDKIGNGQNESPGRVLAVKDNGEFLYQYNGQNDSAFTPVDMCSDENGQVFVSDYIRARVHILNSEGIFMKFLLTNGSDLMNPCRIDIHNSKYIWISENGTKLVKILEIN